MTETWIYCDHAAVGPLPKPARDAVAAVLDAQMREGVAGIRDVEARREAIRAQVAAAIGAGADEIAFMRSTSDGALLVANGLDWKAGDEVIFSADEFGANAYPWLNLRMLGVRPRLVPAPAERLTLESLERRWTLRTRLAAVSYVGFSDGYRHDLTAMGRWCRERGVLFAVDAMQGFGPLPLDVRAANIDFCYFGTAKWLLSPQGLSVVYVRREHVERLRPALCSWRSVRDPMNFLDYGQELMEGTPRFEASTISYPALLGFSESLALLQAAGFDAIERHVLDLTGQLIEGAQRAGVAVLSSLQPGTRSGIVLLGLGARNVQQLQRSAQEAKVAVTIRDNGIRVSPHGYNTGAEMDAVLAALALT